MRRGIYLLPNLFTTANIICGTLACVFSINDALRLANYKDVLKPYELSAWLILLAGVLDLFDGLVARVTRSTTRFGVEYDSLADLISFGIAPAFLLYLVVLREYEKFGWLFALIYVVCGAIRLARFNTQTGTSVAKNFVGLPIPAAAGVLASYVLFSMWGEWHIVESGVVFNKVMGWYEQRITYFNQVVLPIVMVGLSALMVSVIEYPSFKKLFTRGQIPFILFVLFSIMLILVILTPVAITSFAITLFYLLYGPIMLLFKRGAKQMQSIRKKNELKQITIDVPKEGRNR